MKKDKSSQKRNTILDPYIENWISSKRTNNTKRAIYIIFHRILVSMRVEEKIANTLIIIQMTQMIAITTNETNYILSNSLPKSFLRIFNLPLIYSFIDISNPTLRSLLKFTIISFIAWVFYGANKVLKMGREKHQIFDEFKQIYGLSLYLLDTVLVYSSLIS